ncbi:MAG: hypothetical protein J1F36_03190 [Clostridiales bacterium]|nr:hypothetical protein [Clostridiales bacterium]
MRNYFRAITDNKESSHNQIKNAFEFWTDRYAYATYIAVSGSGRRIDKKAELVDYNDNVSNGELYATYRISLMESDFPYAITSIGFAPYAGAQLSNECEVYIKPSNIEIYGTVYLDSVTKDYTFYPGQNPLVQSLLGMRPFENLTVRGSDAQLGNFPAVVDTSKYSSVSSSVHMDEGMEVEFDSSGKTDFLLMCGDLPCARFNLSYFSAPLLNRTTVAKGGFYSEGAVSVSEVKVRGAAVSFDSFPSISELLDSGKGAMGGFDGYELFSDPLYKYAGLKNGSRYYLIDNETALSGGEYSGNIMLCTNGEPVSVSGGKVTFLSSGDSVNVTDGQTVVLYRSGGYDIFVHNGANLYIYRYEGTLTLTKTISTFSGELIRANDYAVIIKNGLNKSCFTANGAMDFDFDGLKLVGYEQLSDGCYYGDGYMGSFLNYTRISCDKSSGRFCLKNGELLYVGEGEIKSLKSSFDFDSAAIAGSVAIFLKNGKLHFYRIGWNGVYVSTPNVGDVDYVARQWSNPSGYIVLKIQN